MLLLLLLLTSGYLLGTLLSNLRRWASSSYITDFQSSPPEINTPQDRRGKMNAGLGGARANYFLNSNNLYIYYRTMACNEDSREKIRNVFIVVHGVGEHCDRYQNLANSLAKEIPGTVVMGLDHVGHGRSEGARMYVQNFNHYVDDVVTLCEIASGTYRSDANLFLICHSLGGLIGIKTLESNRVNFRAAVISAPSLTLAQGALLQTVALALSRVLPKAPAPKIDANCLTHDRDVVNKYLNDPLVTSSTGPTMKLGAEVLSALGNLTPSAITLPYLLMRGTEDTVCLRKGIAEWHDTTSSLDKSFVEFEGFFHEIFNEVGAQDKSVKTCVDFFKKRIRGETMLL